MSTNRRQAQYDVTILGGGMAGLCLARQLLQQRRELRVLVLEKKHHPVPEKAFKVGESTVELGAYYLETILGLKAHLQDQQLRKHGLRFFFNHKHHRNLDEGVEIGLTRLFHQHSYQLDRGRFENFLAEEIAQMGATFLGGAQVKQTKLADQQQSHQLSYIYNGQNHSLTTGWLVDASGRAGFLKRQLGLDQSIAHKINSAWFRINKPLRIDDWGHWTITGKDQDANTNRWLSTIHLMGTGYWVWIIPLVDNAVSVGIVADPRHHALADFNSFDKALGWLLKEQPACGRALHEVRHQLMDFQVLKHFSYGCSQLFSPQRWAITGEAGVFPDPLYSPGADYIAIGNTYVCALIERELRGRPFAALAKTFEEHYRLFFENSMRIYQDQYSLFGNPGVMTVKLFWDYAVYWAFPAFSFCQGRMTDLASLAQVSPLAHQIGDLNARMQVFFRCWHQHWQPGHRQQFLDQSRFPLLCNLNKGLTADLDGQAYQEQLRKNMASLYDLSAEIVDYAGADHSELAGMVVHKGVNRKHLQGIWNAFSS